MASLNTSSIATVWRQHSLLRSAGLPRLHSLGTAKDWHTCISYEYSIC